MGGHTHGCRRSLGRESCRKEAATRPTWRRGQTSGDPFYRSRVLRRAGREAARVAISMIERGESGGPGQTEIQLRYESIVARRPPQKKKALRTQTPKCLQSLRTHSGRTRLRSQTNVSSFFLFLDDHPRCHHQHDAGGVSADTNVLEQAVDPRQVREEGNAAFNTGFAQSLDTA